MKIEDMIDINNKINSTFAIKNTKCVFYIEKDQCFKQDCKDVAREICGENICGLLVGTIVAYILLSERLNCFLLIYKILK